MTADPVMDHLRFTVEQFERMGEARVLDPDMRYELLDGEVVPMSPIGPMHAGTLDRILAVLFPQLYERASVRVQNPVKLRPLSMPQPDLVIARQRRDFYQSAHPTGEDVLLAIEVADSSLRLDRLVKLPIYARHGVPEVWIVDITEGVVHVHRGPDGDLYQAVSTVRGAEVLSPQAFTDITITPEDLLGT